MAVATHFPLKIPQIFFIERKSRFLKDHEKSINSSSNAQKGLKFHMNDPYNCLNKVTKPFFQNFVRLPFLGRSARETGKKGQKWAKMDQLPPKKWQPDKISKNWSSNFVKTLIRIIHMKFQTFLSILRRVDAFFVIFQKTRFSFNKGNLRDFEGNMSGYGQNFLRPSTYDDIF